MHSCYRLGPRLVCLSPKCMVIHTGYKTVTSSCSHTLPLLFLLFLCLKCFPLPDNRWPFRRDYLLHPNSLKGHLLSFHRFTTRWRQRTSCRIGWPLRSWRPWAWRARVSELWEWESRAEKSLVVILGPAPQTRQR